MLDELTDAPVSEAKTQAMLQEVVRRGVTAMLARQESDLPPDPGSYQDRLSADAARIRTAQKARDWSVATEFAGEVATQNGLTEAEVQNPVVARQVLALFRQLLKVQSWVEEDFEDPLLAGRDLLLAHGIKPTREALKPPMLLSAAIGKACEEAPGEVEKKIRVVGKIALAKLGDVPVASFTLEQTFDLLHDIWMLPKGWGKAHGRNRFEKGGIDLDPLEEIRNADRKDAALVQAVLDDDTQSLPDKRRRLVAELTPRLTDGYLIVQRDMLQRIVKAALGASRVGRDIDEEDRVVPSHKQLKSRMRKWHKDSKTANGLPTRVSRPKRRRSWSLEHIAGLLNSPVYLGTSSAAQRWRKATATKHLILRDAIYWVPLIMILMGVRPEETLQLAVTDVVRRDGILAIHIGEEHDAILKNEQSRRILPIPQLLLDLGFRQWVVAKIAKKEHWLFPEILPDASNGRRSQTFGDRLRTLFKRLNLDCDREDIYAMRRTLSSKLMQAGIETGTRQKILGHLEGTTVDRHYSDHGLLELKAILDAVNYGIEIGKHRRHDFPVVVRCNTPTLPSVDVDIALADDRKVAALRLVDPATGEAVFEATVAGQPAPKGQEWDGCPECDAREIASRVLVLAQSFSLTLPASEEATAAFEHMLILADEVTSASSAGRPTMVSDPEGGEACRGGPATTCPPSVGEATISPGDLVVCVLQHRGAGTLPASARPGLVVNVHTLSGRKLLDIALSAPSGNRVAEPFEFSVAGAKEIADAQLAEPTLFNLRRRILVNAADPAHLQGRLGALGEGALVRMRESLQNVRDVAPEPIDERR